MCLPRHGWVAVWVAVALCRPLGARAEIPPLGADLRASITAYMQDPVGGAAAFLGTARDAGGALHPVHAVLLGDAALRTGRHRLAMELFQSVGQAPVDPRLAGLAELSMGWLVMGRGRLREAYGHLEAAAALNPELRGTSAFGLALLAAVGGDATAAATALAGGSAADPSLRDALPLLDAYARYWSGDPAGAADAFTAFAVANPDSRFADDAVYAAAQSKRRDGRRDEARADLEALAGDVPRARALPRRLLSLDGRAVIRDGVRRDRERGTRTLARRFADVLDNDGVELARAALVASNRPGAADGNDGHPAAIGARAAVASRAPEAVAGASRASRAAGHERVTATPRSGDTAPAATARDPVAPASRRHAWWWVPLAAAALLLALWRRRVIGPAPPGAAPAARRPRPPATPPRSPPGRARSCR